MNKIKHLFFLPFFLLLISCSGGDDDNTEVLQATIISSNETPQYDETYTISWESNASQCYATSLTSEWLGELPTTGSQDFIAKREGYANYGVQCRKSINFVNASVNVEVEKDFIDYFDYEDVETFDLGTISIDSNNTISVLDTSISDFNQDFFLDLVLLVKETVTDDPSNSEYYFLTFYGRSTSTITEENPFTFQDINQGACVADEFIRADYNKDGALDLMSISKSADTSLNKRGICFFLASEDGFILQDEDYLVNETSLDLSNVEIGSNIAYDVDSDFGADILLFGNGGTTDLPFYIVRAEEGPYVLLPPPLNTLNPYTRNQGCIAGIGFICDWIQNEYYFLNSIFFPANDDGSIDIIHSIRTDEGTSYNLYDTRIEGDEVYFDWSISENNYFTTSISSGDGYALKMLAGDGNIDGYSDLFVFEKSLSSELYKLSIYEKIPSENEDTTNELSQINNGDFLEEYSFDNSLKFTKDFLYFDFNSDAYSDFFIPYTELPYSPGNQESNKNFLAFEKSYILNEDETNTQEWITQDLSDSIGLDPESINNSWIDFDYDFDIDAVLIIPQLSDDGLTINYNFKVSLNNSLF